MNNKFNEANLIPRMAQIVLNSQEMKDIKEKIEAVGDDVESILDDMESILNGVSTRFPDHVLAKEGDDMKLVSISRLIELMAIYQLDPLKEDPSRIWFEIDVATSGDFKMEFSGGRAWLDTTELTDGVAVPNVVGKHVVVMDESVYYLNLSNNRLQGDLDLRGLPVVFDGMLLGGNPLLTSIDLSSLEVLRNNNFEVSGNTSMVTIKLDSLVRVEHVEMYFSNCTSLESLNLKLVTTLDSGYFYANNNPLLKDIELSSLSGMSNYSSVYLKNSALTALTIENLLRQYVVTGGYGSELDISGGTNAPYSTWSQQAKDDLEILLQRGWIVSYTE